MKNIEIQGLSDGDLSEKIAQHQKDLVQLKLNHAVVNLDNPNEIKASRRLLARLKTEQRKRVLASA
jgi:large subunit ribosomal protein L29